MSVNPRLSVPTSNVIVENTTTYSYLFADKIGSITQGSEKFTFTYDGTLVTSTVQAGVLAQIEGQVFTIYFFKNHKTRPFL